MSAKTVLVDGGSPLETSLVEWKHKARMAAQNPINILGNFLSGMETSSQCILQSLDSTLETSLVEWKRVYEHPIPADTPQPWKLP